MTALCLASTAKNSSRQRPTFLGLPSGHLSVHCTLSICLTLTPIPRDAISFHLVDEFQRNLAQIFITCVGIVAKVFRCRGQ